LDIPSQPELLQDPDTVPVGINLIPLEPVRGRCGMRMMIVVPAFAKSQEGHPPAVSGKIAGSKAPRSPGMGCRIHQPGRMQEEHGAEEHSPEEPRQAADCEQDDAQYDLRNIVILR